MKFSTDGWNLSAPAGGPDDADAPEAGGPEEPPAPSPLSRAETVRPRGGLADKLRIGHAAAHALLIAAVFYLGFKSYMTSGPSVEVAMAYSALCSYLSGYGVAAAAMCAPAAIMAPAIMAAAESAARRSLAAAACDLCLGAALGSIALALGYPAVLPLALAYLALAAVAAGSIAADGD